MIDSVHIHQVVEQGIQEMPAQEVPTSSPDEQDVDRFQTALADTSSLQPEAPQAVSPEQTQPVSLGDTILQSLESQRTSFQGRLAEVDAVLGGEGGGNQVSPAGLLDAQMKLQQAFFEVQLSSKVVEKGNEGISTLLKNQG